MQLPQGEPGQPVTFDTIVENFNRKPLATRHDLVVIHALADDIAQQQPLLIEAEVVRETSEGAVHIEALTQYDMPTVGKLARIVFKDTSEPPKTLFALEFSLTDVVSSVPVPEVAPSTLKSCADIAIAAFMQANSEGEGQLLQHMAALLSSYAEGNLPNIDDSCIQIGEAYVDLLDVALAATLQNAKYAKGIQRTTFTPPGISEVQVSKIQWLQVADETALPFSLEHISVEIFQKGVRTLLVRLDEQNDLHTTTAPPHEEEALLTLVNKASNPQEYKKLLGLQRLYQEDAKLVVSLLQAYFTNK